MIYNDVIISNKLSYDVLELVFTFLSLEDHVHSCLVSKQWFYFIMGLPNFSKLCLNEELPSLINSKDKTMELLQYIMSVKSSGGLFVIPGTTPLPSTVTKQQQHDVITKNDCSIAPMATVKLLDMILKRNDFQIDILCFKDWITSDEDFEDEYRIIIQMLRHPQILTYHVETTTVKTSKAWYKWNFGFDWEWSDYEGSKKLLSITIDNNEEMRQQYKESGGWYPIDDSFPRKEPHNIEDFHPINAPIEHFGNMIWFRYFKLSTPTISVPSERRMYPDHSVFGIPSSRLVYLYLDALNQKNPLISARVASDNSPIMRTIVVSPLAELPKKIRYNDINNLTTFITNRDADENIGDLRCFVWTMGNSRPVDRTTFQWHCRVNRCKCFNKHVYRILNRHYQHLELLYLQFDGAHGIAFRSMRFLSLPTTLDATNLRELHLHATSCTLFGHFRSTSIKDKMVYGTADDINQYLVRAISHMPALEIISLENDYVDYDTLLMHDESAHSSIVYMTINDDVLLSLASHCIRLKEVVIWGPHMAITGWGVVEFALMTIANQGSLTLLEVDCLLSDDQVTTLLHSDSLKNLKVLKSKNRPLLYP
ncbi:hypothetical protein BDA99DRAFT_251701 [Phascolomyces articulosus]|uniref:F-box domain-containing protein n=1 Tax=Phascolomyces articulosus TaxID=60185 RepID=A0AAD5P8G4_9FUNG|nr:hypothetical protein BDA99DRAFT_251701 [Phascolomyces articulosus]